MNEGTIKITRTTLALTVSCKCGSCIAATMLYGGIEIDADFMDTLAEYANNCGKIEIIDTREKKVSLRECRCNILSITH